MGFIASHPSTRPSVGHELRIFIIFIIIIIIIIIIINIIAGRPKFDPGWRRSADFFSLLRVQTGHGVLSASSKRVPGLSWG